METYELITRHLLIFAGRACVPASDTVFNSDFQAFQAVSVPLKLSRERFHETQRSEALAKLPISTRSIKSSLNPVRMAHGNVVEVHF